MQWWQAQSRTAQIVLVRWSLHLSSLHNPYSCVALEDLNEPQFPAPIHTAFQVLVLTLPPWESESIPLLGGTSAYTFLLIIPSASNSRNCCVSIFWLTGGIFFLSSPKRNIPDDSMCRMIGFHLPPITFIVVNMGQLVGFFKHTFPYSLWPRGWSCYRGMLK